MFTGRGPFPGRVDTARVPSLSDGKVAQFIARFIGSYNDNLP